MAQANIKAVIIAEDRSKSVLAGFGNQVEGMGEQIAQTAKNASKILIAAAAAATGFAIKSAADFEQTRIGMENMLGSADKARSVLADVSKFAAETPFEFPELANSVRQLLAFGFNAEDAVKTMKQLGDISAAVGAPIGDLSYLMGTLRAQGRAFTIDIRQFASRGIPIYEYLGKVLNVDTQALNGMIEAGKVGFPDVQKAFEMMTAEGGKFHGTMAKQSKSLSGLFSTLKDNISMTARELVGITQQGDIIEGSLFDKLRKGVAMTIEALPAMLKAFQDTLNKMSAAVSDFMPTLTQWAQNIAVIASKVADYLLPKLEALWNTVATNLGPALERLWKDILQPLVPIVGTALVVSFGIWIDTLNVAYKVIGFVIDQLVGFVNFITGKVIPAIESVGNFMVDKFNFAKDHIIEIIGGIIGFFATLPITLPFYVAAAIGKIIQIAASVNWGGIFSGIWQAMQGVWDRVTNMAVNAYHNIRNIDWGGLVTGVGKSFVNGLIGIIESSLRTAVRGLPGDVEKKINLPRFAGGTAFAPGGTALVGERGPELVSLPRGSQVMTNDKTRQIVGSQAQTINITIQAGAFMGSQQDARKYAQLMMDAWQDLQASRGVMA